MGKNYTIFAHAVHSQLQLIKNKLDAAPGMSVREMIDRNNKYFETIADYIKSYYHHRPGITDFMDAAEMYLSTLDDDSKNIMSQPEWKPKQK